MTHTVKVTHNAGLFSCFSQRLSAIIRYANQNKTFPDYVDSSEQFRMYKVDPSIDITDSLIQPSKILIPYGGYVHFTDQFTDYSNLDYTRLNPIISKYFTVSDIVYNQLNNFINKYNIDLSNSCSIFYRGNDKRTECQLATPETFIQKAQIVRENYPSIKFFVQTDDSRFLNLFMDIFKDAIYLKELQTISNDSMSVSASLPREERLEHAINLLAAVNVVARCKYLITHSGNCGYWACLYRGNSNNIIQHFTSESNKAYGWLK